MIDGFLGCHGDSQLFGKRNQLNPPPTEKKKHQRTEKKNPSTFRLDVSESDRLMGARMSQPFISQRVGYQIPATIHAAIRKQQVDTPLTMVEVERCPRCQQILLYEEASSTYRCPLDGFTYFAYRPQESCDEYDNIMQFSYHHQHGDPRTTWNSQHYLHQFSLTATQWEHIHTCYHTRLMRYLFDIQRKLTAATFDSVPNVVASCDVSCWEMVLHAPEWRVLQPWSHLLYQCWLLEIPWEDTWHIQPDAIPHIATMLQTEKDPQSEQAHVSPVPRHKYNSNWLNRLVRHVEKQPVSGLASLQTLARHVGTEKPMGVATMKKRKTS